MRGKWERQTGKHESGENYRIGPVIVGAVSYNGMRSKDDPKAHKAYVTLPGIHLKTGTDTFVTIEEAKRRVESVVDVWFKWLET